LIGPSGSGKEILARAIHEQSPRASSPFVTIPCATLVPESFEDVLFGREEEGRVLQVGLLEQAHGGTLFLDAVQEIPLITQGKMVRVLQEHEFKRMDGLSSVSVDVRIIASTSIDLKQAIQANLFRDDLYYRLNVIPIEVPSLRSRHEDIRGLLNHFLDIMCTSLGISKRTWSEDAMAALEAYSWPGNVRELKNVIERALLSASGKSVQLGLDVLPLEVQGIVPMIVNQERTEEILSLPLKKARDFFERQYLLAQVERFGGNISRTAEFVGMERSALHRKLRALQVDSLRKQAGEG
jgi:two-component system nitrogen regulation response regulator NtrX